MEEISGSEPLAANGERGEAAAVSVLICFKIFLLFCIFHVFFHEMHRFVKGEQAVFVDLSAPAPSPTRPL